MGSDNGDKPSYGYVMWVIQQESNLFGDCLYNNGDFGVGLWGLPN
jgi:hypothetical protein